MKIRQVDLAVHAGVSRQWLVAMEQGKPSLEIGLVLRTLEALGLAVEQDDGSSLAVANGVQLGAQAALRAPDTPG